MKIFFSYLIICIITPIILLAQSPGGVGTTNLRGWFIGQTGITLTSGAVSQWNDNSPLLQHGTQTTAARRPVLNATGFNYHQTISFDGFDDRIDLPNPFVPTGSTALSVFAVARQTAINRDPWGTIVFCQSNAASWTGGGFGLTALNGVNTAFGFWVRDWNINYVSTPTTLANQTLMTGTWNGTTANNVQYFQNATSMGTDPFTPGSVGNSGPSAIGSSGNDSYCFYGDIAEVVIYNSGLSLTDVDRINSYLAIKYGITLSRDYLNSSGNIIYNVTAPYNHSIIGIGRDDNTSLNQKQSRTIDDSTRIYISSLATNNASNTGSFSTDNQYLIIGHNNGLLSSIYSDPEKPVGIERRLQREWKITNTNFNGTFNLDIRLNNISNPTSVNTSDLALLIDDDGNFSNALIYDASHGLTFSYASNTITVTGITNSIIPINSTRYFTIGSKNILTPLPIELVNFSAVALSNKVILNWTTASEINNDYFELEKSIDGLNFVAFAKIKGAGNSNQILNYSHTDYEPYIGTSYYRLKQVDFDGKFSYSNIIAVNISIKPEYNLSFFPNPTTGMINFNIPENSEYLVEIFDLSGNKIISENINKHKNSIHIANFANGYYIVNLTTKDGELLLQNKINLIK